MISVYQATPDISALTSTFPVPGFGVVPINAFVLHGPEPVLVDTGAVVDRDAFMTALATVIDPADVRWIWLTHTDFDHIGSLSRLLAENGDVRVITTFLAVGMMSLAAPLPMDRVQLVNPGQRTTVGDRTLLAIKPPTFDNPATTGFVDEGSGVLFSSDCFGALLSDVPDSAADLTDEEIRQGQMFWAAVDSPWLHNVDPAAFSRQLNCVRELAPTMILSSHLPAAPGRLTDRLVSALQAVPSAPPFVGPDQAALEAMLAQMTSGALPGSIA